MVKRRGKYNNQVIKTPDGTFHSKGEYTRWCELKLMQKSGLVSDLERQVRLPLFAGPHFICDYVLDFRYRERLFDVWALVHEDFKGVETDVFRIKAKLVKANYGIDIKITGANKGWPKLATRSKSSKNANGKVRVGRSR